MTNNKVIKGKTSDIKINYKALVGNSWEGILRPLLQSNYMSSLIEFLNESYKLNTIRPSKANIFKPFKETPFTDLRVVIIGKEPYDDNSNTGIPFANDNNFGKLFNPQLLKVLRCVENDIYDGIRLNLDYTLEDWTIQDVLLLNTSLTMEAGKTGSHSKYWRNFIRETLKIINEWKTGTIFLLWGEEAQQFKQYINVEKNYVLECEHPEIAVKEKRDWNCNHFSETNKILNILNGPSGEIEW